MSALLLAIYYWRMDGEQFEILKELCVVGGAARSAHHRGARGDLVRYLHRHRIGGDGRLGAMYLAVMVKYPRSCWWWSLAGAIGGVVLGWARADFVELLVSGSLGATFFGTLVPGS